MAKLFLCLVLGYLIGSLNFAIIYSKLRKDDIRNHGSKNAGATNVLRTYGKFPALIVFLLDILKGVIAVLIVRSVFDGEIYECTAALGAVLGHNFPVYYKFSGGKGVSTSFAVLCVLHYQVALVALLVFVITVLISRYVSLSSILASVGAVIAAVVLYDFGVFFCFTLIIAVLCIIRHHANISRLLKGTENKLGKKKE